MFVMKFQCREYINHRWMDQFGSYLMAYLIYINLYCYCYYRWEVELLWLTLALTPLARVCFSAYPQRQTPKEQGKGRNKER